MSEEIKPSCGREHYTFITEPPFEIQKDWELGSERNQKKNQTKIIALLSKALLVITLIENVQMFVKNFYIKPSNDFGYRYYT